MPFNTASIKHALIPKTEREDRVKSPWTQQHSSSPGASGTDTSKCIFAPAKQYHTTQFSLDSYAQFISSGSEQHIKGASVCCKQLERELQNPNTQL